MIIEIAARVLFSFLEEIVVVILQQLVFSWATVSVSVPPSYTSESEVLILFGYFIVNI